LDALIRITPNIGIIFVIILVEGLLGGSTYVNAYYRISQEVSEEKREYSMSMTSLACTVGISMAGVASIGILPFLRNYQLKFRK
jgi:battenin